MGAFGVFVAVLILWSMLVPLALDGESSFQLLGERVTATEEDPWPAILGSAFAMAFMGFFLGPVLLFERESRKGAPEWTVTDAGLVRRRGEEVRTIPWSRLGRAWTGRVSRDRRNVYVSRAGIFTALLPWMRVEEGRVWTLGQPLCVADVERPHEVAALLDGRMARR